MTSATELLDDLRTPTRDLQSAAPEAWAGFAHLHRAALSDGALPASFKELIALAIAAATHCESCVAYHARGAARRGATAEEVAEALSVALLMGGGPASVTAPRAWEAFTEFSEKYQRSPSP